MSKLGSSDNPLKVAIVGAGPSGFYAADALINSEYKVEVNVIEKLCAPYGLVRTGVAPDHPLIKKSIEKLYKVNVIKVNTLLSKDRFKTVRGKIAKKSGYKKAIITLKEGQSIDIAAGI